MSAMRPNQSPFSDETLESIRDLLRSTDPAQRQWLAGYVAGWDAALAAGTGTARQPAAAAAAVPAEPVLILYGTESGNCEQLAAKAQALAKKAGLKPTLRDMADLEAAELTKARNLVVIAATWGEGEPPQRAAAFYRGLMGPGAPRLDGLRYSVLALGDRAYVQFCEIGKRIDERLAELGAVRIAERVDCDLEYAKPAAAWTADVLERLRPVAPATGADIIRVDFAHAAPAETGWSQERPFAAEITERVDLNGSRSTKRTFHVELSLEGSGLAYEPGDSLAVVPQNDPALVDDVLKVAGLGGDAALRDELIHGRDVTTLSRATLAALAELRPSADLAALLDGDRWQAWIADRQLVDLLSAFPGALDAEGLRRLTRPLAPRSYSIASSLLAHPDEAHLLVGLVQWASHGRERRGVASGWIGERVGRDGPLQVFVKPNRHFRLPTDGARPVVMVGAGTGVAPYRAFLEHRRETGATGRNWLFFGDRNYTHDFLYQLEWQQAVDDGLLTRIDVAFSRDQPEKRYIQHELWERRAELWAWLEDGAHFYVCGDAKGLGRDVDAMLVRIVQDRAGVDADAARDRLERLSREHRYQRDVY